MKLIHWIMLGIICGVLYTSIAYGDGISEEVTTPPKPIRASYTIEMYQDVQDEWRWRLTANNGRIIADSAESYTSRFNLIRAVAQIQRINLANVKAKDVILSEGEKILMQGQNKNGSETETVLYEHDLTESPK